MQEGGVEIKNIAKKYGVSICTFQKILKSQVDFDIITKLKHVRSLSLVVLFITFKKNGTLYMILRLHFAFGLRLHECKYFGLSLCQHCKALDLIESI